MKNITKLFFPWILFLGGCATIDSGAVDFRRVESQSLEAAQANAANAPSNCKITPKGEKIRICAPMVPARLDRKFVGKASKAIKTDDVYSIRLDYGVIADMNEMSKLRLRKGNVFGQNGEIAVLVKAFEFSADAANADSFLDFNQATANGENIDTDFSEARVVYFNPDVDAGQALNISNIPILGPVKYEGRPVGLQIIVIELDKMSDPVKSMLQNLAGLGRSYANAGPVTNALFDLGTSLVEGSQDDIIFEYRMVMDNATHTGEQIVSPFESGRLVFRRAQYRDQKLIWRNMRLDENTGALYVLNDCGTDVENCDGKYELQQTDEEGSESKKLVTSKFTPYSKETYFVVNFINHGENGPIAFYEYKTLGTLEQEMQVYINDRDQPIATLNDPIVKLIGERQSLNRSKQISKLIEKVGDNWVSYSHFALPEDFVNPNNCEALFSKINSNISRKNLLLANAQRSTSTLYDLMKKSSEKTPTTVNPNETLLKPNEQTVLLSRLSEVVLGRLSGNELPENYKSTDFISWDSFWTRKYGLSTGNSDLITLFDSAAKLAAPRNCEQLNAIH